MTPYAKAKQILEQLITAAGVAGHSLPPAPFRYAQIGTPVLGCEQVTVSILSITADPASELNQFIQCDAVQLATVVLIIARTCNWTADTNGIDDPAKVAATSAQMDADGTLLWNYANDYEPYFSKTWELAYTITGGLGITTLTLTTGVD